MGSVADNRQVRPFGGEAAAADERLLPEINRLINQRFSIAQLHSGFRCGFIMDFIVISFRFPSGFVDSHHWISL